ncbi:hypothetical protein [Sinomonas susongensis]|uniref:hypothetical protein n=1 Tax=Sinomonas susongensis TaxID=1324851 RepID=UPI001108613F|nr:hypothetical protein [Sinomonas susongensis]
MITSVFPTMVLLDESSSQLRCRMLGGPIHLLRRQAHRLGKLVAGVPGVLGVRETLDGVLIDCEAGTEEARQIRKAVGTIYSVIAGGGAYPATGRADG